MRRRLTTIVMEAPRAALFDNVPDGSTLESASLSALLTCDRWTDRVLGLNRKVTLPNRVVWIATGNSIRLAGDLGRRSLSIQIEPGVERPSLRTFDIGDLQDHVAQARIAAAMGYDACAQWVREHRDLYARGVFQGFEVDNDGEGRSCG